MRRWSCRFGVVLPFDPRRNWRPDLQQMFHGIAHHVTVGSSVGRVNNDGQNGQCNHFNPHSHFVNFVFWHRIWIKQQLVRLLLPPKHSWFLLSSVRTTLSTCSCATDSGQSSEKGFNLPSFSFFPFSCGVVGGGGAQKRRRRRNPRRLDLCVLYRKGAGQRHTTSTGAAHTIHWMATAADLSF